MIFYTTGQSTYLYWCSTTKPLSCTLPWVCVHVCVKQTRQFRLWWLAHSDPAPAPRGYPSVPLSRCGKAKCWMGYPVAPAWLLGSRRLNQSQIGLWMASYEYIFLRLHTQENTSSRERVEAIYYDSHYNVDITCTPAPRFKFTGHSHSFRWFTFFFSLDCSCLCVYILKKIKFLFFLSVAIHLSSPSFFLYLFTLSFPPFFSTLRSKTQFQSVDPHLKSIAISAALDMKYRPVRSDTCVWACLFVFRWLSVTVSVQNNQWDTW